MNLYLLGSILLSITVLYKEAHFSKKECMWIFIILLLWPLWIPLKIFSVYYNIYKENKS